MQDIHHTAIPMMLEAASIVNHITCVVLCSGMDDTSPMSYAITHLVFLSPADFVICTRDDLNSLGSIAITWAQKNHIMNLCHFWG